MKRCFHPQYQFGRHVGPARPWFAWFPVKTFYGRWAWLKTVSRQRVAKLACLDGPDWAFWSYADEVAE
jgi:hypothetical protein